MIPLQDITRWQELRRSFAKVFRARWFWILILVASALGLILGLLLPITSGSPM